MTSIPLETKLSIEVLRSMYLTRFMDDKLSKLVRQNKGGTFHLSVNGHELIGCLAAHCLVSGKDWGFPYYRDRGFALGLGCCPVELIGSFLARDVPNHSGGRMMPEHFVDVKLNIPCQSSCVGSQFLQATGTALSAKLRKKDEVVYVSAGDGATSQGDFHEALNFASIHKLPVIFVIQDNEWAISVPQKEQTSGTSIAKMTSGYEGLLVQEVDGGSFEHCLDAMKKAIQKGRAGQGPSLLVAKVPRIGAHSSSDDPKKYKSQEIIDSEVAKDPILKMEKWILSENILTESELEALKKECKEAIETAAKKADEYPYPDPKTADTKVFKEFSVEDTMTEKEGDEIVMMDALNHALVEEMEKDKNVIVFGQDVAHGKGGVFGITRGLTEKFGYYRCFNTPLAESTIVGIATGLSFDKKHKPVAEIQFADYSWTAMNQLINEVASIHYRSNGQNSCPIVIRMPYGGYIQGGPYHSQSIEGFLTHQPGLKVVIPSNAADAKRLLKTAILDPNPVVFLEHKALYRQRMFSARKEPDENSYLPFGKANVVTQGNDVTVIAWGMMAMMGKEVSDRLKQEGISVELIDLRTLVPLDLDTILQSVRKTGKVLIVHEAQKNCGFGAELSATITEHAFDSLDAPIKRLTGKDCVVPYSKVLEDAVLPQKEDLLQAIRKLANY
ncbi:MAG: thiamine pyrophosphate-dependent enzyme [Chlamydiota bacterium]